MGFWKKILSGKRDEGPIIAFGRFTDAHKSKEHYAAWDDSLKFFEEGQVQTAVEKLVIYLKNAAGDNIQVASDRPEFRFVVFHGSKQLNCLLDQRHFRAEAKIAHCKELNVGFLRRAVEFNFDLNYSRYALDPESNLCLVFDSSLEEASPYKLFYGLKEMALQADKEDDILLDEFEYLEPVQNQHIKKLPPEIVAVKIRFIRTRIEKALSSDALGSLNPRRFQGALTYLYLSVVYTLDYLVKPEGPMMDMIGNMHIRYFETPAEHTEQKISLLESGLREIRDLTDEEMANELYEVISTFGITSPANHKTIAQFIEAELQVLPWYEENNHDAICISICNYIAGYCLYNFSMAEPVQELLHMYFEIVEADYFRALGFDNEFMDMDGKFHHLDRI
ncbi:MAG TPA: hypothetical protein VFX48_01905, partial [Saprospiraceae bacterium]|nr:hypothetical protein [Saprospiraceae bacterium]